MVTLLIVLFVLVIYLPIVLCTISGGSKGDMNLMKMVFVTIVLIHRVPHSILLYTSARSSWNVVYGYLAIKLCNCIGLYIFFAKSLYRVVAQPPTPGVSMGVQNKPHVASLRVKYNVSCRNSRFTHHQRVGIRCLPG